KVFVVKQESLTVRPCSRDRDGGRSPLVGRKACNIERLHSGREENQLLEISAIQRQLPHLSLIHQGGNGRRGCFNLRNSTFDRNCLLRLAYGKREIDNVLAA